jgi:hypothetical protein
LTFGLGIIILQGVSRRKSLAGVNITEALSQISKENKTGRFLSNICKHKEELETFDWPNLTSRDNFTRPLKIGERITLKLVLLLKFH